MNYQPQHEPRGEMQCWASKEFKMFVFKRVLQNEFSGSVLNIKNPECQGYTAQQNIISNTFLMGKNPTKQQKNSKTQSLTPDLKD